jgi:formamidopyrimidine-DNA glycosylase
MPELPEVETVVRGLAPTLVGRRIAHVEQRRADLRFPFPERFAERLEGRRVTALRRRAKYILAGLDDGTTLLVHLGMTGRVSIAARPDPSEGDQLGRFTHNAGGDARHDHVVVTLEDGARITYNDVRRFGFMTLIGAEEGERHPLLAGLGVEPLEAGFDAAHLARRAHGRSTDLKAFLMDQRIVAGLGNIYVSEALFRSGLAPTRLARTLATPSGKPRAAAEALAEAIRAVLVDAIAAGGSSLRDYRHTDGSLGYFQTRFAVYAREGEACPKPACDGTVQRRVQAGRATFHCPRCQR